MFRSAKLRESDLAAHRFDGHIDYWTRTANTWFDGTTASVDERIAQLDRINMFARDTMARLGSTPAGFKCGALLPDLERTRRELAAARDSLLKGFADRQDAPRPAGRRTANADEDDEDTCDHPGCNRKLDDGEGYDGYCGEHADKREREGKYSSRTAGAGGWYDQAEQAAMNDEAMESAFRPGHEPDYAGQARDWERSKRMQDSNREWQDATRGKQRDQYGDIMEPDPAEQEGVGAMNWPGWKKRNLGTGSAWENGPGSDRPPGTEGLGDPRAKRPPLANLQRAIVLGSRDFVAEQNTDDRDELLLRARRYAAAETSTLPIAMARRISAAFVGQVEELIARRPRKRQASAPVTHYEDFDDQLMY